MNILNIITSFFNRYEKSKKFFGWFIKLCVYSNSIIMWLKKNEYESFSDCLFHSKKVSQRPWIGERTIEYAWVYKFIRDIKNKRVLDIGAKNGLLTTDMLLENKNIVHAIDINVNDVQKKDNLIIEKGDIVSTNYSNDFFDEILLISTLEHIGISGRYHITEQNENLDFEISFTFRSEYKKEIIKIPKK